MRWSGRSFTEPFQQRAREFGVRGPREKNEGRREPRNELFLHGRQIVETVEEARRVEIWDWRIQKLIGFGHELVLREPASVSGIGGRKLLELPGLAGCLAEVIRCDRGLIEVLESLPQRRREASGVTPT